MTLTLPNELNEQILAKAEYLATDPDKLIIVLLRSGLLAQEQREREISRLAEDARSTDPEIADASADKLGELIFGA